MVFKVIRKCLSLSFWEEIKIGWDLKRKIKSVVRVYKRFPQGASSFSFLAFYLLFERQDHALPGLLP
jgi:hypothetical protein